MESTNFDMLVRYAIGLNKENRELHKKDKNTYSDLLWLMDFCTVRINIGRAVGKTRFITENLTDKDVALVHSRTAKGIIQGNINNGKNIKNVINISDMNDLFPYICYEAEFPEYIFIDEPRLVFANYRIEEILGVLVDERKYQTVIMLGA